MKIYDQHVSQRQAILSVMKQGGYYTQIMNAGPELERVKEFLLMMEGKLPLCSSKPYQECTILPIFPGLRAEPFRSPINDNIAKYLANANQIIKEEVIAVKDKTLNNKKQTSELLWRIYPLWYLGADLSFLTSRIPNIKNLVTNLPRSAIKFPLAESIVSWLIPYSHLPAHSSTDNLRLRYSLGVVVEDYCEIRVGQNKMQWQEGECIIFEDCFEHEAWNGAKDRCVLITDTWHPDLTDIEIEALTAGFRKSEIRKLLFYYRKIDEIRNIMFHQFEKDDAELSPKYWEKSAIITMPTVIQSENWSTTPVFSTND